MIDKDLCYVLKQVRLTRSIDDEGNPLNITDFAKKLGVSRSAISEVESLKREPSKKLIKKIKDVYGINLFNLWHDHIASDGYWEKQELTESEKAMVGIEQKIVPEEQHHECNLKINSLSQKFDQSQKEIQELRGQIKKLESELDDWREQARFLKGLLEGKK